MTLCACGCGLPVRIAERTRTRQGQIKGVPLKYVNGHNGRGVTGPMRFGWKGEAAGYMAIHNWVRRHKTKRGCCSECGKEGKTDWANLSGEYRRDLEDYRELCRSCHMRFDRLRRSTVREYA